MKWIRRTGAVVLMAGVLGACATNEYTVKEAQRDLVKSGLTEQQASCVLDGLRKYYADQYVKLNNERKVDAVNPDAVALYVRNVFASQEPIHNDERALAKRIVAGCKR